MVARDSAAPEAEIALVAKRVRALQDEVVKGGPQEVLRHHLEPMAIYDRCRGLYLGVLVLVEKHLGQEAMILARPLYTDSLRLMELASQDESGRIELVVGWALGSLKATRGRFIEAQQRGEDVHEYLAAVDGLIEWYRQYAGHRGVKARAVGDPNEKQLAGKHGRDNFLDFSFTHEFVHGTAFALGLRYRRNGDQMEVGPVDQSWHVVAAAHAAESMLHAIKATCSIFGWSEPSEVDDLMVRLDEATDRMEPSQPLDR